MFDKEGSEPKTETPLTSPIRFSEQRIFEVMRSRLPEHTFEGDEHSAFPFSVEPRVSDNPQEEEVLIVACGKCPMQFTITLNGEWAQSGLADDDKLAPSDGVDESIYSNWYLESLKSVQPKNSASDDE